ncbi:IpaB/EvcA family protein [Lactiplantibacillus sp. WILCCON 0030]|uniref:IpaB/EvcA family protein n=1 Tax=Lactiplantibacillus brownii TaxID=3069269 RepID=A0ABU1A606_9LACO|nr:IpaB/EvcA family protein [Lactiplantibacillus brownii]MDQ7936389.1 IpaB/EvcA family protein [Lactiplantibacillus brownii]
MTEPKLTQTLTDLLGTTNSLYPGNVTVSFGHDEAGYVRHDQANQVMHAGNIDIHVADVTAPNYTASHEMLHLLLLLQGFPQITFNLTTRNQQLDEQLMAIAMELYDAVAHVLVVKKQREHALIDDQIETLYFKGIYATIDPEKPQQTDAMMTLRLLTLTDLLVFFHGDLTADLLAKVTADFPKSWAAAQKLYTVITEKAVDTPFAMRRAVVKLFKAFDEQMALWELPLLHGSEFVTMQSVFSEHQLRLEVRQLFDVYHSDMLDKTKNTRAYIGLNKGDRQNAFVVPAPAQKKSDEFFKELYGKTVKELFTDLDLPFTLR